MTTGKLAGKTALITGASRGIGRAIAEAYAREGASLVLSATSLKGLEDVTQFLTSQGVKVTPLAANLSVEDDITALFQDAVQAEGQIDILINNAGLYHANRFENYTLGDLERLMRVNVYAVFKLMQLAVSHMKPRKSGKIVNIGSTAGKWESANQSAYNTTKHAVVGLSKCVALEAAPFGINVNTICPGMVETDMIQNFEIHADIAGVSMDDLMKAVRSKIPMGRFMQPAEIANLALYLGSEDANGMTGQTMTISGGMRMG